MSKGRQLVARAGFSPRPQEGQPDLGLAAPPSGATAEHMALINAMPQVLRPLAAEDVFVRGMMAANDLPMRRGWMIEPAGVAKIAELAPGVPVMFNHDEGWAVGRMALPAGRLFAGAVVKDAAGATWADLLAWFPATEANAELVQMMDGGAVAEMSVSIGYDLLECNICQTDLFDCAHMPGEVYEGKVCLPVVRGVNSFREQSIAWAGDVQGTRFYLAASDAGGVDTAAALEERKLALAKRHGGLDGLLAKPLAIADLLSAKDEAGLLVGAGIDGLFTRG